MRLLLRHFNLQSNDDGSLSDDQILTTVTLATYFVPGIPHPLICLAGPQGSAKTTFMQLARKVVDPSGAPILRLADSSRELAQQLQHNYCPCYDNLSNLGPSSSDILCSAVTGAAFSKRALYTDEDDVVFDLHRCIIVNGINVVPRRPDLLDRSIIITLPEIRPRERIEEREIYAKFEADLPRILGGMFNVLSKAMKIKPTITVPEKPRMADYAVWGCAFAEALGIGKERFLAAYNRNVERQVDEALNSSIEAQAILEFMQSHDTWKGTATTLLSELNALATSLRIDVKDPLWPKGAQILSRRLNEDKIPLRNAGVEIEVSREGQQGVRQISLRRSTKYPLK